MKKVSAITRHKHIPLFSRLGNTFSKRGNQAVQIDL